MPINGSFGGVSVRGFRPELTYVITASPTSVNEGSSVTFVVRTTNFGSGTLYWTLEAVSGTINNSDFSAPVNAVTSGGSVVMTNNVGTFAVTLANDATTEGAETFRSRLRTGSTSGTIVATSATITINDTSQTPAPTPQPTPQPIVPQPIPQPQPQPIVIPQPQPIPQPVPTAPAPVSTALCGVNCAGIPDGNPCAGLCAI
jgi:hypothetical protein